jgi:hypothetical protein
MVCALTSTRDGSAPAVIDTRRVLPTVDAADDTSKNPIVDVLKDRKFSVTQFYAGLQTLRDHFATVLSAQTPLVINQISGTVQPDESPAAKIAVTALFRADSTQPRQAEVASQLMRPSSLRGNSTAAILSRRSFESRRSVTTPPAGTCPRLPGDISPSLLRDGTRQNPCRCHATTCSRTR